MLATTAVNLVYDSCLALVYPQACAVCGDSVEQRKFGVACAKCWDATQVFSGNEITCWKCGLLSNATGISGTALNIKEREQLRCRRCDTDAFDAARACGAYEGALRASVLHLKREPQVSEKLVELMVKAHRRYPLDQVTRIIPVPLHHERQKTRGFNQAAIVAQALSSAAALPFDEVSLVRTEHTTRHRAGMDAHDRRASVEKAFAVTYPALIAGEKILLVDDVFTSGATVSACAQALLGSGAAAVYVLTIARPSSYDM